MKYIYSVRLTCIQFFLCVEWLECHMQKKIQAKFNSKFTHITVFVVKKPYCDYNKHSLVIFLVNMTMLWNYMLMRKFTNMPMFLRKLLRLMQNFISKLFLWTLITLLRSPTTGAPVDALNFYKTSLQMFLK